MKAFNPDPYAPENNLHHLGGYRNDEEFIDENLCRGPGDPDYFGYPGEPKDDEGFTYGIITDTGPIGLTDVPF
jgi:hypothetical protein